MIAKTTNSVSEKFSELNKRNEKALITYVVGGYPDIATSKEIVEKLIDSGADIIEIGIPFSDPMADGPVIQRAFVHALDNGINPIDCLNLIKSIKKKQKESPILVMTYSNIIYSQGLNKFLNQSLESGVDGLIVPDLNFEEAEDYLQTTGRLNLATVFLTSPNTDPLRLSKIASVSTGFVYLVSVYGITGARNKFENYTFDSIKKTIRTTSKFRRPLAVGFGISTPTDGSRMLEAGADGIIIGSSLIKIISKYLEDKEKMLSNLGNFVEEMKKICKSNN